MMEEKTLLASFVAVESAHAFSAFCPSIFTIKSFATDDTKKNQVRQGYYPAIVFSLVLGYIVSKLTGTYLPLYFSVATIIFMVIVYESAMKEELSSKSVESGL